MGISTAEPEHTYDIAKSLEDPSGFNRALATKVSCGSLSSLVHGPRHCTVRDSTLALPSAPALLFGALSPCWLSHGFCLPMASAYSWLLARDSYCFTKPVCLSHGVPCVLHVHRQLLTLASWSTRWRTLWFSLSLPKVIPITQWGAALSPGYHNSDTYLHPSSYGQDLRIKILPMHGDPLRLLPSAAGCVLVRQSAQQIPLQNISFLGHFQSRKACYMRRRIDRCTGGGTYYMGLLFSETSE